eukprot:CAMPEP_0202491184 /NCGR_PEP_ID=MMETSP1361-20130828/8330_1 /ASSEMBLY_ACC=CAM_ASM_000849 /TAXON_ID=210615 /ORGANISM="Staurosira complex sp., Strain CCMP2646" /LENGTH=85 /DNA_ID=CAMNT_0049121195 /DNA_START=65 /DNA_END=322 /DNA_ORIENTATION=+
MNALARSLTRTVPRTSAIAPARRTLTTWPEFKKHWLSDPGSYPVIAVMCIALVGCSAKGTHYLATHPDARIAPSVRQANLRTWGA